MSADGASISTVEHGGFTIEGSGSAENALASLAQIQDKPADKEESKEEGEKPSPKETLSQAASELGKKGGKAAAKARAAAKAEPAQEAPVQAVEPEKAAETKAG